MQLHGHDIAVCSWSLQPTGIAELVAKVRDAGLAHVQLALADLLHLDDARRQDELRTIHASGIALTGGMLNFPGEDYSTIDAIRNTGGFVPDALWPQRRDERAARALAAELGLKHITAHVGFVPHATDAGYAPIVATASARWPPCSRGTTSRC